MNNFLVKVTYKRLEEEDRVIKLISEQYLVFGEPNFTAAEKQVISHVKQYALEFADITIDSIRKINLASIETKTVSSELDRFWKAKIAHTSLDDKTGKEKIGKYAILIEAESICEANKILQAHVDEDGTGTLSPISLELLDIVDLV